MVISDNIKGALFMLGAMTAFTVNDACMKSLSGELPLFQALLLRSCGVIVFFTVMAVRGGVLKTPIPSKDRGLIILRSVAETAAAFFFISALFNMPLANVSAILQVLPLSVTLAAAVFLGERVGWRRWIAIVIGFIGVMLILRPGGGGFGIYSFYAVGAVACVTVRDLCVRRITAETPSLTIALGAAIGVLVFSGFGALAIEWQPVTSLSAFKLAMATGFVIAAYMCSVMAMRSGEIAFVAPFRYSSLVVAMILGVTIFGETLDAFTLLGSAIVVGAGLYTFWREQKVA